VQTWAGILVFVSVSGWSFVSGSATATATAPVSVSFAIIVIGVWVWVWVWGWLTVSDWPVIVGPAHNTAIKSWQRQTIETIKRL